VHRVLAFRGTGQPRRIVEVAGIQVQQGRRVQRRPDAGVEHQRAQPAPTFEREVARTLDLTVLHEYANQIRVCNAYVRRRRLVSSAGKNGLAHLHGHLVRLLPCAR